MKKILVASCFIFGITGASFAQRTAKYLVTESNYKISADNFKAVKQHRGPSYLKTIVVIINDEIYRTDSPEFTSLKKEDIKDSKLIKSTDQNSPVEGVIIITTKKELSKTH